MKSLPPLTRICASPYADAAPGVAVAVPDIELETEVALAISERIGCAC